MDPRPPLALVRRAMPGKHDSAPYGSTCKVRRADEFEMYLQMSDDEENPRWEMVGFYPKTVDPKVVQNDMDHILEFKT